MGVFKKPEDKREARVTFVMTPGTRDDFALYCKACGLTMSEVLRDFVLTRVKKFHEKA